MSPNTPAPLTSGPLPPSDSVPPSLHPNTVEPNPRAVELRPVKWSGVESNGLVLTIHYVLTGRAECNVLGRADVAETDETVTVTLLVGRLPEANCDRQPLTATVNTTTVTLSRPLRTRALVDGGAHS